MYLCPYPSPFSLSLSFSFSLYPHPPLSPSAPPSLCLSISLSVSMFLSLTPSLSVCLFLSLSISLCLSHSVPRAGWTRHSAEMLLHPPSQALCIMGGNLQSSSPARCILHSVASSGARHVLSFEASREDAFVLQVFQSGFASAEVSSEIRGWLDCLRLRSEVELCNGADLVLPASVCGRPRTSYQTSCNPTPLIQILIQMRPALGRNE